MQSRTEPYLGAWDTASILSGRHRTGKEGLIFAVRTVHQAKHPSLPSIPISLWQGWWLGKLRPREERGHSLDPWSRWRAGVRTQAGPLRSVPPLSRPRRESMLSGARGEVGTGPGFLWKEDPDSTGLTLWALNLGCWGSSLALRSCPGCLRGDGSRQGPCLAAVPPGLPQDPLGPQRPR